MAAQVLEEKSPQQLKILLTGVANGTNFSWYNGKTKLPSTVDGNFLKSDEYDISAANMTKVVNQAQRGRADALVVLLDSKHHDSKCKCPGCGGDYTVAQTYASFWEENGKIKHNLLGVDVFYDMYDPDPEYLKTNEVEPIPFYDLIKGNENLIFTLGSYFDFQSIIDTL